MRTLHTVMKRGAIYWDQGVLPAAALQARLGRIQTEMGATGDDAWLVMGDVMRYGQLAYVSQFVPRGGWAMAVVPRSSPPVLLVNAGPRDVPDTHRLTWIDDVRPLGGMPAGLVRLLAEQDLGSARIGLVGARSTLKLDQWRDLSAALPGVSWVDRDEQLLRMRAVKEAIELAAMQQAGRAVQAGLEVAHDALKPGSTVRQALALVDHAMRYAGAEDCRLLVASGPQTALGLRPPDDRLLEDGDPVMLLAAACFQHYWVEAAQTFALGSADHELGALTAAARQALQSMLDAALPPVESAALEHAAHERLAASGIPMAGQDQAPTAAQYGMMHGIGLDPEEPPVLGGAAGARLHAGQTLALHVVLHGHSQGAIAGTTVAIEATVNTPLVPA